ncbi:hypothetical protein LZ554_002103 [Drepanopeziza brunnea f. sp. 'monogermtubi']|nr:hypothetical protein LZ554_002103 [Drepanopeziza brunnea f. sp. 'monogermtubi']
MPSAPSEPIPRIGLGTFRLKRDAVTQPLLAALRLGYRHIDTASIYNNEPEIGRALQAAYADPSRSIRRSDLWITSKLSPYDMAGDPRAALLKSLRDLQTPYLDLYLVHWPAMARTSLVSPENRAARLAAWKVLNEARAEGLVRSIGVSNFTVGHLRELQATEWGVRGIVVQMEVQPWYWRDAAEIARVFEGGGVRIVGYALLAEGRVVGDDGLVLDEIAERRGMTRVQVVLAWALRKGWGVLVKSVDVGRLEENLETTDLALNLTEEDCAVLDEMSAEGEEKCCWDPRSVK